MEFGPQQIGRFFIFLGLIIAAIGVLFLVLGRIGFFRLPGDFAFGSKNWRVYFPLASCIIISIIVTIIFWLIGYFRR